MKVLWFTNTPSLYQQGTHHYHGVGWVESLECLIKEQDGVELAISFFHKTDNEKVINNGTTYFPILRKSAKKNPLRSIINSWTGDSFEDVNIKLKFSHVIIDFKPDVIHVFGTEGPFSKIQELTKIPVVIHIQGIINPYLNTYYPVNQSKWSFLLSKNYFFNNIIGGSPAFGRKRFAIQAKRERNFLSKAKYIMGRTQWDKMLVELYNPTVQYFHVEEVLRPEFYKAAAISKQQPNKQFKIISTLSPTIYKGIDLVLKTAKQLKELTNFNFQWEIIGLGANAPLLKHFEKTEKIKHREVNIICCGRKKPKEIIELMQTVDVYVHPSYIDNSPNSVCEAQILGLPVIACNVGGVATLVEHEKTGFLVPSNGVFEFVHYLRLLKVDENLGHKIGQEARRVASMRHDRDKIVSDLLMVYSDLSNKKLLLT
jgi:glycosyltransferase involved in cell wall biosynthesis